MTHTRAASGGLIRFFPLPALNTPAAQRKKGATIASRNSRSFYYAEKIAAQFSL